VSDAQDLLRRARAYRPPTTLHPIAVHAVSLHEKNGDRLLLTDAGPLRDELNALRDAEDFEGLADALCGLAAFIWYSKEHLEDETAAATATELIKETAPVVEFLQQQITDALADQSKNVVSQLDRFAGAKPEERSRAPKIDAAPPPGSVSLASLKPPARPPPHLRKKT